MANTYTWRPTSGRYFNASGTGDTGNSYLFYNKNRAFYMGFPNLGSLLGLDKKTLHIRSAILRVRILTAYSATLTMGYNYSTAWANRKSLLAQKTNVVMKTSAGDMDIDLTEVIQAYVADGNSGTMYLWGYGTAGSTTDSYFRGINPSSNQDQRPYLGITYDSSITRIYTGGAWKVAVPYIYANGQWKAAIGQLRDGGEWK